MTTERRFVSLSVSLVLFAIADLASAQTWTQASAPSNNWYSVALSADGSKLFASGSSDTIYISVDSGATWTPTSMSGFIVACSADGSKVVVRQGIYTSENSGATWSLAATFPFYVGAAASSADGNKIAVLGYREIYTSTNSGATWTSNTLPTSLTVLASSADGTRLVGGGGTLGVVGLMAASTDSGATWNLLDPGQNWWHSIASSADGRKLAAYGHWGGLIISTNSGATWTSANLGMIGAQGYVVSSADGSKLMAYGWGIFTSSDSGQTWVSNNVPPEIFWYSAASSADGNKLVAVEYGGTGIWISQSTPGPQLSIARDNAGLTLSWIIPSANFVLQQSADLRTADWTEVLTVPSMNYSNLWHEVVVAPSPDHRFYRLALSLQ
jgi:hypothetical protein